MLLRELHHSADVGISAHILVIERDYDIVARFESCFLRPVKNCETEFPAYRACSDKELILFRDFMVVSKPVLTCSNTASSASVSRS